MVNDDDRNSGNSISFCSRKGVYFRVHLTVVSIFCVDMHNLLRSHITSYVARELWEFFWSKTVRQSRDDTIRALLAAREKNYRVCVTSWPCAAAIHSLLNE